MAVYNASVAAGADDAAETAAGTFSSIGTTLSMRASTSDLARSNAGFRFVNVTIPAGSTINSAVLTVDVVGTTTDDPNCDIFLNDVDDAANFTDEADINDRPVTAASTSWVDTGVGAGAEASPDFAAAVQEVIDRAGWASGQDICVIVKGKTEASGTFTVLSQEGSGATSISIDYTEGEGTEVALTGSQPAMTGLLAALFLKAIAGAIPAATGALTTLQMLQRSLAGSQPASTAALSVKYLINLSGAQPASAGTIASTTAAFTLSPSAFITASGENTTAQLTAPAGKTTADFGGGRIQDDENPGDAVDLALDEYREDEWSLVATLLAEDEETYEFRVLLEGVELDSYSVTPTVTISAAIRLTGDQPASSGSLSVKYLISLAGSQPASTGVLSLIQTLLKSLAGSQPAMTGTLAALQSLFRSLTGSQPASTGALTSAAFISLTGSQPASTGAISVKYLIALSGVLSTQAGAVTLKYLISLAGNQPAMTGTVATAIALFGNQPEMTGVLTITNFTAVTGSVNHDTLRYFATPLGVKEPGYRARDMETHPRDVQIGVKQ